MSLSSFPFVDNVIKIGKGLLLTTALAACAAGFCTFSLAQSAEAVPVREDEPVKTLDFLPKRPVSMWKDDEIATRGIVVAVHGLVMHGRVYDTMARELASQGMLVFAPDLRGYGRWTAAGNDENSKVEAKVAYERSFEDLKELVTVLRSQYPDLPIYMVGESMGAGMSIRIAAALPDKVDGLVLSSPAIKRRFYLEPEMVKDLAHLVANPMGEVNLVPYIKKFASEDPVIADEALQDPFVRKHLNCLDLLNTASYIKGNINHVSQVPADMPVLIIQGDKDRMLRCEAVKSLMSRLKSRDTTMCWLKGKGHVLIETSHIEPSTMTTIKSWLNDHVAPSAQSRNLLSSN
ncbi:MAG: alpha/beta fold hydrolase [Candidatus Melainabacteria bacterium]|nr:alpha/beta fold hydrolase [Candidatus Melainabacteria bacterium]